jgi:hypothetical protein
MRQSVGMRGPCGRGAAAAGVALEGIESKSSAGTALSGQAAIRPAKDLSFILGGIGKYRVYPAPWKSTNS